MVNLNILHNDNFRFFILSLFFWQPISLDQLLIFVFMGAAGLLSHWCLTQALRLSDTTVTMPLQFTKLIWASIIGYIIFFEKPDLLTWIGGTTVFIAVLYITYRENIYKKESHKKIVTVRPSMET